MKTKKSKEPQEITGLFAFWRYDQYPYVLGAPFTKMDDEGKVYVPDYQGWFRPIKLVPIEKGRELLEALRGMPHGLEEQRDRALEAFKATWDDTLFELFPEARHPNIGRHWEAKKP